MVESTRRGFFASLAGAAMATVAYGKFTPPVAERPHELTVTEIAEEAIRLLDRQLKHKRRNYSGVEARLGQRVHGCSMNCQPHVLLNLRSDQYRTSASDFGRAFLLPAISSIANIIDEKSLDLSDAVVTADLELPVGMLGSVRIADSNAGLALRVLKTHDVYAIPESRKTYLSWDDRKAARESGLVETYDIATDRIVLVSQRDLDAVLLLRIDTICGFRSQKS